jgi:hypothetical protein
VIRTTVKYNQPTKNQYTVDTYNMDDYTEQEQYQIALDLYKGVAIPEYTLDKVRVSPWNFARIAVRVARKRQQQAIAA